MPKVKRKTACFCSRNSAHPFAYMGAWVSGKNLFQRCLPFWCGSQNFGMGFLFWNTIVAFVNGKYLILFFTTLTAINDKNGNKRQKRQVVLILNYLPKTHFQSLNISSSAISMAVFKLFCMILNNSYSKTDFLVFFFLVWF